MRKLAVEPYVSLRPLVPIAFLAAGAYLLSHHYQEQGDMMLIIAVLRATF